LRLLMEPISIVVLQHNLSNLTKVAVESIFDSDCSDNIAEVIIVDNNSSLDEDRTWIKADKRLKGIFLKENLRYVGGTNAGWRKAKAEYILLCNNDLALSHSCIRRLYECFQKDSSLAWVSACYIDGAWSTCSVKLPNYIEAQLDMTNGVDRSLFNTYIDNLYPIDSLYYCDITEATVVMVRKSISDVIGYFCEDIHYHHTHEYSLRLIEAGYKIGVCKNAVFWHRKDHPTIKMLSDFNIDKEINNSSSYMDQRFGSRWHKLKR
jgi:GT2 family glycosyltransferase